MDGWMDGWIVNGSKERGGHVVVIVRRKIYNQKKNKHQKKRKEKKIRRKLKPINTHQYTKNPISP